MQQITVFGAGIFGLSLAWIMAKRGASVEVVDPHGVAAGASGGLVGALAPHTPENWNPKKQIQFESLEAAGPFWAEVAEQSALDPGYGRVGRWQPILDMKGLDLARARAETAKIYWQGRYHWHVVAEAEATGHLTSPTGFLIHDTLSARLHPRRATQALAAALARNGVSVRSEPNARPDVEVHATGAAGLEALSQALNQPVGNGVKGQAALLRADLGDLPQIYAEMLHIVPHADGTVAIGSTSERTFDQPLETDAQLDALIEKARRICPTLAKAPVVERWAGLRPRARSRAPILGQHPDRPHVFIANGGFKIGFGMAPKIAEMMADLILDGHDWIPESFRIEANLKRA